MFMMNHSIAVSAMVPLTIEMDRDFASQKGINPLVHYNDLRNSYKSCRPLRLAFERVSGCLLPCMSYDLLPIAYLNSRKLQT